MLGSIISSFACILFFSICTCLFFEFELKNKKMFIFVAFILFASKIIIPTRENVHLNLVISILTYLIIPLFFFKGKIIFKIIYVLSFVIISSLCELFTMKLYSLVFFEEVLSNNFAFILGILTTNIVLLIVMYVLSLYWKAFTLKDTPRYSWLLLCLPITTLLLIANIEDYNNVVNTDFFLYIILGLLLSNVTCIFIYYKTVINISKEKELQQNLEKTKIEYEAAATLLSQHNVFLHDIRHQSSEMLDLLKQNKYVDLENYIKDIYSDSTNIFNMINSNYKIVDLIINDRIYIIKNNNIQLRIKLENTESYTCDMAEMEKIFKSLIDLAIHECICSKIEEPFLIIKSKQIEDQLILIFNFSSNSALSIESLDKEVIKIFNSNNIDCLINNSSTESTINILFSLGDNVYEQTGE